MAFLSLWVAFHSLNGSVLVPGSSMLSSLQPEICISVTVLRLYMILCVKIELALIMSMAVQAVPSYLQESLEP